jgi:O-antigen/teichoic acid export membrane protein
MKKHLDRLISEGLKYRMQILNAGLRLVPMVAKFALTLYMGRYFELSEIGLYGLVMGAVSILTMVFGQNFAYIVNRDVVGAPPATALHKIRDEIYLYLANYAVMALGIIVLIATHATSIGLDVYIYTFILTVIEGVGTVTYFNMNALNQQVLANALFFVRAGVWVFPVMILCIFFPSMRDADTVLLAWVIGSAASLVLTLWCWRKMPWKEVMPRPVEWGWIWRGIRTSFLVWLGIVGVTLGSYVDRFVVQHFLTLEDVGVLTFYFSFTNALMTLMVSGVSAFATPRMVQHHRDGDHGAFAREAGNARRQIAISAGAISIALGIAVPILGKFLGRQAFIDSAPVFWLMLFSTWLRVNADILSNMLYARHQDKAVWMGNLLFLIPAIGCNLLFVPFTGLIGIGYGAVSASLFLTGWRWWHVRHYKYE